MRTVTAPLMLALLWMLLFGTFDLTSLLTGLVVGLGALAFSRPIADAAGGGERPPADDRAPAEVGIGQRAWSFLKLAWLYTREVVVTNLMMTRDVLRPGPRIAPAIFPLHVPGLGRAGTTLLANLLTLTPGSIVIDYDERTETLYIHTLYAKDIESMTRDYRRFARQIYRAMGRRPSEAVSEASP